jgi:hypothetical protein
MGSEKRNVWNYTLIGLTVEIDRIYKHFTSRLENEQKKQTHKNIQ